MKETALYLDKVAVIQKDCSPAAGAKKKSILHKTLDIVHTAKPLEKMYLDNRDYILIWHYLYKKYSQPNLCLNPGYIFLYSSLQLEHQPTIRRTSPKPLFNKPSAVFRACVCTYGNPNKFHHRSVLRCKVLPTRINLQGWGPGEVVPIEWWYIPMFHTHTPSKALAFWHKMCP